MDAKDKKILGELKKNSRSSIRQIAKSTGIRPSTVHKRIQDLVKNRIIEKFTTKLSNDAAEENFIVFILLKTKPGTMLSKKWLLHESVKEVFGITGDYDIVLKSKFKDISSFNDFLINLRKDSDIETTNTMIATLTLKEEL